MTVKMNSNAERPADDSHDDDHASNCNLDGLSNTDRWRVLAGRGDVIALLRETGRVASSKLQMDVLSNCIHDAMEKCARDDPAAFMRLLQTEMVLTIGGMAIRAQHSLNQKSRLQANERDVWADSSQFDAVADKVMALDAKVAKVLNIIANTQLVQEQARKLRLNNNKAESKKNRPRQPRRRRISPRPQAMTPNSRISENLP